MVQVVTPASCRHLLIFLLILSTFPASADSPHTVVFLSDFGTIDDSVAICKGVMLQIDPHLKIIDLTHDVTPFAILDAARFIAGTSPYFPAGTVFLGVVDPGVGSVRKPLVLKSKKNQYFVLPDNGLISLVEQQDGIESAREIKNVSWLLGRKFSSTFHGRDIFAPVAARLARGDDWIDVGPDVTEWVQLKINQPGINGSAIEGEIIGLDGPYGNLITNISEDQFAQLEIKFGQKIIVSIDSRDLEVLFVKTFSDVPLHAPLVYVDSRGRIGLALNQGNFASTYKVTPPTPISIKK